jgi:hypothetical protein
MDHPDTIVEVHREQVQDETLATFSHERYSQSVGGPGFSATASLDLTLDRVWFILDSNSRAWQEEVDGNAGDPQRHFAIDLAMFDSKIRLERVMFIPFVPLPPKTVTIPDGPRAGESKRIPYNEIPLFGRVTIHDHLECRQVDPVHQTISLNFAEQDAPVLVAPASADEYAPQLFGPDIDRRAGGDIAFGGNDPRITWDLDYAEAYWITHSIAGELLTNAEKLRHLGISDDEARTAVLDFIADQIAASVRREAAGLGKDGVVDVLPTTQEVHPEADDDNTVKALDAVVHRFDVGGVQQESMVVQLQTLRELPPGEGLTTSALADRPDERAAVAQTGWSILRQVRDSVMNTFGLDDSDFDPEEPCLLNGPKTIKIGGAERCLDSLTADVVPRAGDGKLMVDGKVSAHTALYDFDASFTLALEMGLDAVPRNADELQRALREAADSKRCGDLSDEEYESEVKRVHQLIEKLPLTVGVRPTLNPPTPIVNPEFSLTAAGHAATAVGVAALVGLLALPVTWAAGAAGLSAAGAGGLLTLAIAQYITTVITIDWFGTGIGMREVRKSLDDRPEGTLLPPVGIPIDVNLTRQRLAVYFRQLPPRLAVSCAETEDDAVQVVGGRWPTDGKPWKLAVDDAELFVESDEVDLVVEYPNGERAPIKGWDSLRTLPECGDDG